jgi:hypothetical protein
MPGYVRAGQMTAALPQAEGRKVRAPQDRVLGNSQSWQQEGKCHRKQTAPRHVSYVPGGKGETVR